MEQLSEQESKVNQVLSSMPWCDAHIIPGDYGTIVLAMGEDLDYYHTIEVIFSNVQFSYIKYWFKVDTQNGLFQPLSVEKRIALNQQHGIEVGYRLFQLKDEDDQTYHVAAKDILINQQTVLYYAKEDLQENERMASWVKMT